MEFRGVFSQNGERYTVDKDGNGRMGRGLKIAVRLGRGHCVVERGNCVHVKHSCALKRDDDCPEME